MATVGRLSTARAMVEEGGVVAVYSYDNGHGKTVFVACLSDDEELDLFRSPYVDQRTVKALYKRGEWLVDGDPLPV